LAGYWQRVAKRARKDTWKFVTEHTWRSLLVSVSGMAIAAYLQLKVLGMPATKENLTIVGTSVVAGILLFIPLFIVKFIRMPHLLEVEMKADHQKQISQLDSELAQTKQQVEVLSWPENGPKIIRRLGVYGREHG
jgi:hypothetical protein